MDLDLRELANRVNDLTVQLRSQETANFATLFAAIVALVAAIFAVLQARRANRLSAEANGIAAEAHKHALEQMGRDAARTAATIRIKPHADHFSLSGIEDLKNAKMLVHLVNLGEDSLDQIFVQTTAVMLLRGGQPQPIDTNAAGWRHESLYDPPELIRMEGRANVDIKEHLIVHLFSLIPDNVVPDEEFVALFNTVFVPRIYGHAKPIAMARPGKTQVWPGGLDPIDRVPVTIRVIPSRLNPAERKSYFEGYRPTRWVSNEFARAPED